MGFWNDWLEHNRDVESKRAENGDRLFVALSWGLTVLAVTVILASAWIITSPVSTSFACSGTVTGNVQFDGKDVNVRGLYDFDGRMVKLSYPGVDVPVKDSVSVPDFTQARLNAVHLDCSGGIKGPSWVISPWLS